MSIGISGLIGKGGGAVANVDKTLQIWGLSHLVGETVSVFLDGQDGGDYTVAADGSITMSIDSVSYTVTAATLVASDGDYGESTTPILVHNGSATPVWTSVGVVVGQPFVSQGQRLRPATAADGASQQGPILGMTRRTDRFAVLVQDAIVMRFGTSLTPTPTGNMIQAIFVQADDITPILAGNMFSGVYWSDTYDGYGLDGGLCWQVDRPWPATVCAVSQFLTAMER